MSQFGEFHLHADLGRGARLDRYKATHDVQGGPFYLCCYSRVDADWPGVVEARGATLLGLDAPHLVPHLGHGRVGPITFTVAPWVDGISLPDFAASLKDRRVPLPMAGVYAIIDSVLSALVSLHKAGVVHGEVAPEHVRIDTEGGVWLTSVSKPREDSTAEPLQPSLDVAGAAAMLYDLMRLTRTTGELPPFSPLMEAWVRRGLGFCPEAERLDAGALLDAWRGLRADEGIDPENTAFAALASRTAERVLRDAQAPEGPVVPPDAPGVTADLLMTLEPEVASAAPVVQRAVEPEAPPVLYAPVPTGPVPTAVGRGPAAENPALTDPTPVMPSAAPAPISLAELTPVVEAAVPAPVVPAPVVPAPVAPAPAAVAPVAAPVAAPVVAPSADKAPTNLSAPGPMKVLSHAVQAGLMTAADAQAARLTHAQQGGHVTDVLLASAVPDEQALARVLATAAGVRQVSSVEIAEAALTAAQLVRGLPETYLRARRVLPLGQSGERLLLAVQDPFDADGIAETGRLLRASALDIVVAPRAVLLDMIRRAYAGIGVTADAALGGSNASVLLCTPSGALVHALGARLVAEGFVVEEAQNATVAARIFAERPPAAVIIEHGPAFDAVRLVVDMRQGRHADLPMYVVGEDEADLASRMVDLGADDYFEKPLRIDRAVAKIRRAAQRYAKTMGRAVAAVETSGGMPVAPTAEHTPGTLPMRVPGTALLDEAAAGFEEALPTAPAQWAELLDDQLPPDISLGGPPVDALASVDMDSLVDLPEFDQIDEPPPRAEPTGVMGTLRQMGVPEIVQSLTLGKRTALVELGLEGGVEATIGLMDGEVVYADMGPEVGEEAFFALAPLREGFFRIRYSEAPAQTNIDKPSTFLLLEAMRKIDEAAAD